MSSSALEVVSTTTGIERSSGSALTSASTSRPSMRGRLRSSRIMSGRSARLRRKSIASTPSPTTCRRLRTLLCSNASWMRTTSPGSSSTSRTPIGLLSGWVMRGQSEAERRARAVRVGVQPHAPAVVLDDLAAHGQADAGPLVGGPRVQALEDDEDPVRVLRLDADAVVRAAEAPRVVVGLGVEADDGRRLAAELHRVADEVLEDEPQQRPVAADGRQRPVLDARAGLLDGPGQVGAHGVHKRVAVHRRVRALDAPHAGEGEEVVDELLHAPGAVD